MGGVTTLFVGILAISNPADAISLIGNNPLVSGGTRPSSLSSSPSSHIVVGFTLPTGSNYSLDSITLRLNSYTDAADTPLLQIYADPSKTRVSPFLINPESVLFSKPSSASNAINLFTFTPTSTFTFLADTRYWLKVGAEATSGSFNWMNNGQGFTNDPTGISGLTYDGYLQYNIHILEGDPYVASTNRPAFDIQVNQVATPVPFDFDPSFGVAVLGGGWLLRKHLKNKKSTKV